MKYLNYLLIIIAIIGGIYVVITKDDEIGLILKDLSLIITMLLPYIIEKLFKVKIDERIKFIYLAFVFCAQFLGTTLEWYNKINYFDKINHTLSGVLTAYASLVILHLFNKYEHDNVLFNIVWMISVTLAIAGLWEIFEYLANIIFGGDAQRVVATGVNDTMQDIIVAFLGSIMVALVYRFYNKNVLFTFTNSVKKID